MNHDAPLAAALFVASTFALIMIALLFAVFGPLPTPLAILLTAVVCAAIAINLTLAVWATIQLQRPGRRRP
jgi:hypothetical protein